jgi:CheY-like chemotaxis protein
LAITSWLVDLMGGKIWVESSLGKGSNFHVIIPFQVGEITRSVPLNHIPAFPNLHVLLVDDNASSRQILAHQIEKWVTAQSIVSSGAEALACLENDPAVNLVITDSHLPGLDGSALVMEINRRFPGRQISLIMLSSLGQRLGRNISRLLVACLPKPVKRNQLFDLLTDISHAENRLEDGMSGPGTGALLDPGFAAQHPQRILLAEDNLVNQKVAMQMLTRLGYSPDLAANGLEVLLAMERRTYDLVLMDIQMPEMDGLQAARIIRERWGKGEQAARIIAMTAYAFDVDRDRFIAAGMDGILAKPVQIETLLDLLRNLPEHSGPTVLAVDPYTQAFPDQQNRFTDSRRMKDLQDGLGDGLVEVIDTYLADSPRMIDEMKAALERADLEDLSRMAHALKSSSAIFGAHRMMELCKELENHANLGRKIHVEKVIHIEDAFADLCNELTGYIVNR